MAAPPKPSRSATLLHVIRALIDIGRQRLAAIRSQRLSPEETRAIAIAFGTFNVALIVARILRGLRIAAALEEKVTATAARIDAPPVLRAAAKARGPRSPRKPRLSEAEDNAALLDRLPTDREIAAMLRRRPIGSVLVDICADLGIGIDHPLWHELQWVIIDHGGLIASVIEHTFQRLAGARRESEKFLAPDSVFQPEPH